MSSPRELPPPRAILFDWDNTLVNNWGVIAEALNAALVAMDQPAWTEIECRQRIKASLRDSFPQLFGARWQEAMGIFYNRFADRHLERLRAIDGAAEMLDGLAARGLYLGVVSNKTGRYLRSEAEHLGWSGRFARIVGAGDAPRDKPAVDPVDLALEGSGIGRGPHVWFVGDTDIDMECAVNAGCLPILLRHEAPGAGEFARHPPAGHRASCTELLRLVVQLQVFPGRILC